MINDAVPERRNLIVFCLLTMMFIFGGGKACETLKLPLVGIELTEPDNILFFYWAIFIYLIARYWSVFRATGYREYGENYKYKNNSADALADFLQSQTVIGSMPLNSLKWNQYQGSLTINSDVDYTHLKAMMPPGTKPTFEDVKGNVKDRGVCVNINFSNNNKAVDYRTTPISLIEPDLILNVMYQLFVKLRLLTDAYAFSWYFPWLILLATSITLIWSLLTSSYELCSK